MDKRGKSGFTLLELVMVIVIIGILVALAAPSYFKFVERSRKVEGLRMLGQMRLAQLRYYALHAKTTDAINDLDIDPPQEKYFSYSVYSTTSAPEDFIVARATRTALENSWGTYNLTIKGNGEVGCEDAGDGKCLGL